MKSFATILSACNFSCVVLLTVLASFYNSLHLSDATFLAGRFHILLLHLPIGGVFALACLRLFKNSVQDDHHERIYGALVSVVVFVSLLSALTGLFISASGDYGEDAVAWHRKSGVSFSILVYAYSVLRNAIGKLLETMLFTITIMALIITGHQGGMITHGAEFLKIKSDQKQITDTIAWQKQPLFESVIMPVIQKKCVSCHNERKSKGELVLTHDSAWQRGGKSGPLLAAVDIRNSLIMKRINLPEEDEYHMPPVGKPQLSHDEITLIDRWIMSGADYTKTFESYRDHDSLMAIVLQMMPKQAHTEKHHSFSHASSEVIRRLNNPFMSVIPIYEGSQALSASFFVASAYNTSMLASLSKVQEQLVQLNLSGMPLGRKDLEVVSRFKNLETLQLNNTAISDHDVLLLSGLQNVTHLSMLGCNVSPGMGKLLHAMKKLQKVHLGSPKINKDILVSWQKKFPDVSFITETTVDEQIPLSPPIFRNENAILEAGDSIRLMHPIKGAEIWYVTDGSMPDTVNGQKYRKPISIRQSAEIKAIAVKRGWITSEPVVFNAYTAGIKPKKLRMVSRSASQYPGRGEETFTNNQLALISNTRDANWIGYREEACVLEVEFDKAVDIRKVALSFACHIPQYIFPPTQIKVFGGNDIQTMQLLENKTMKAITPLEKEKVAAETAYVDLSGKPCRVIRIEAYNLPKIPSWHPGKGERGWLFIDELFFYR